jgi:proprotein convertase subtilisin/kexin type 5
MYNNTDHKCLCRDGFYDNGSNSECFSCHYSCNTCINGNQASNCVTCLSSNYRFLYDNSYCDCLVKIKKSNIKNNFFFILLLNSQENYFDDGSNMLCNQCHRNCIYCSGTNDSECLKCRDTDNRVLTSSSCQC